MNKGMYTGRITREPELETVNGVSKVYFRLAVRRDYKNKDTGEYEADFIAFTAWRHQANYLAKYIRKGDLLEVESVDRSATQEKDGVRKTYAWKDCRHVGLLQHVARTEDSCYYPDEPDEPVAIPPMDYYENEPEP